MKIYSFDTTKRLKRDPKQGNLFNLFEKNIMNVNNVELIPYVVPREYEMRLDRISEFIYGTSQYVEELMVMNDILNPYSIKEGQIIYYCDVNLLSNFYTSDKLTDQNEIKRQELMNSSQNNRSKFTLGDNQKLPPNIKPSNLEQIKISKDNTVSIINTFE